MFPADKNPKKRPYEDFRWSRFKHFAPADMYEVIGEHVFPWLRTLSGNGSTPRGPDGIFSSAQVEDLVNTPERVKETAIAA